MIIQKQTTGEVWAIETGRVICSMDEVCTFELDKNTNSIAITDSKGIRFVIPLIRITGTQLLPSALVPFSGTLTDLWQLLKTYFFLELHDTTISFPTVFPKITMSGVWNITGVLAAPIFAVDQNNYSPVGFVDNTIIKVSSTANRDITGFAAPGIGESPIKTICNVGSNNIRLINNSILSGAANRILLSNNETLNPNESAIIWYDQVSQRWRMLSKSN